VGYLPDYLPVSCAPVSVGRHERGAGTQCLKSIQNRTAEFRGVGGSVPLRSLPDSTLLERPEARAIGARVSRVRRERIELVHIHLTHPQLVRPRRVVDCRLTLSAEPLTVRVTAA
jgi:hypothetical protein